MLYGIAAATAALLLAAALTALLRTPALRLGLVGRRPRRRVPLCGGPAVVLATCAVVAAGQWSGAVPLGGTGRLLVAGGAVALLGWAADARRLRARVLYAGTAVAAACVMPYEEVGVAGGVLGALWVAAVAVGFRALDRADGVAGTVGVVAAFGVGVCAAAEVLDGPAVLLSVLAAALTGFLMHNWPPARVGLGACGALFAGFVPATVAVRASAGSVAVPLALTGVLGVGVLLVRRVRRLGLTAQGVAVVLGAVACAGVALGVLVRLGWVAGSGGLWTAAGALIAVLLLLRGRSQRPRRTESPQVGARLRVRNG
ncbi:undecaprenyl/decaprenyl-phosphate alpha-N-acetylglucosaminyl 1-phosphate transferase [Streptomyces sp. NPDC090106]|uniref:undecaprenyl/decaprenyl-phosphate alpha-N-acetylglucosaminyl 1-phosphate transferase n=1 Tax=Streptomyces sp. NPDC090106 TaxID=3365946 RepID=UPI0037FA9BCD